MARAKDEGSTKRRILEAAARVFAERGFDGARVDEIAKRAAVNKALIYYYYESKEELLNVLFTEIKDAVLSLLGSPAIIQADYSSPAEMTKMMVAFLELLEQRQDVIRIALMECAKRTPINDRVFTLIGEVMERMFGLVGHLDSTTEHERADLMITEFFTGIMPLLNYVAYHELWMEQYGIDEATLRSRFIASFLGTHFAYTVPGFSKNQND